jgi:replicative DNA helicase
MRTESLIFSQLLSNETYTRKVTPHLKEDYFQTQEDKVFYKIFHRFFTKHNAIPSKQAMAVEIDNLRSNADLHKSILNVLNETSEFTESMEYLVDTTEKYCKERALFNALKESVMIVDGQSKMTPEAIPTILQQALSVCFNTEIGHDYIDDAESRYDYYHSSEFRIPMGLKTFDDATKGGIPRKTLNVLLAPPHGGKSLVMVNMAAGALAAGFNVLYITMEMAEEEIGKRFDVNRFNVDFDTLETLPKQLFMNKITGIMNSSQGKLKIQEYPTGGAHAGHFKSLIQELKQKQNWTPDLIVVDYMGICSSERYKASSGANSYTIMKSVGEELRSLAIETNTAIITAVQTNRSGVGNSDVDMTSTSESLGIPAIADLFWAIINTDELKDLRQLMFKQLKNRYKSLDDPERFVVGVDTSRMKLHDLENAVAQKPAKKGSKLNTNENLNVDMLHTIPQSKASFDEFNF